MNVLDSTAQLQPECPGLLPKEALEAAVSVELTAAAATASTALQKAAGSCSAAD
jgi:hypothetical protein